MSRSRDRSRMPSRSGTEGSSNLAESGRNRRPVSPLSFSTARTVSRRGGRLVLCHTTENVSKVLAMSGLSQMLPSFPTLEQAVAAVSQPG